MRGGKRPGAGRKLKFAVPTQVMRVPVDKISDLHRFIEQGSSCALPLFTAKVSAGFPSPADDYIDSKLDLNEYLIHNPSATFFARASGDSMIGAGIHDGDLLIVDKSIQPIHGKIVIAVVYGELTVKRLHIDAKKTLLLAENPEYPSIELTEEQEVRIWGVVTNVIHPL